MFRIKWMSKAAVCFYALVSIVLVTKVLPGRKRSWNYMWSIEIPISNAKDVWDFLADLNHFRITDPGVVSMKITSDQWSHPQWRYGATLKEVRPETGEWETEADYIVTEASNGYLIFTQFRSCGPYFCVDGHSEVTITSVTKAGQPESSLLQENLTLQTNWFVWPFLHTDALGKVYERRLQNVRSYFVARSFAHTAKVKIPIYHTPQSWHNVEM